MSGMQVRVVLRVHIADELRNCWVCMPYERGHNQADLHCCFGGLLSGGVWRADCMHTADELCDYGVGKHVRHWLFVNQVDLHHPSRWELCCF